MGRLVRAGLLQAGLARLSLRASQAEEASVLTGREEATIQLSVPVQTLVCCPSTRRSNSWPNQWCGEPPWPGDSTGLYLCRGDRLLLRKEPYPMKVFVLSCEGSPLMPTTPRRARIFLTTRRAHVVTREPFTIQLRFETTTYTQPVTVGVDTGSHTVGIAATTNREVVFQAEMRLCTDISGKLTQRRQYRRRRRSRKTRHRAARWANRRRASGWLPPSLRARAEATVKAVREHLLAKWQRQCAYCQTSGVPLQVEHLIPKSRGGSDRASNLVIAYEPCNKGKGSQTAEEFGYPEIQAQARVPLKDAAHVSSLKTAVVKPLAQQFGSERVAVTYGFETKYQRIQVLNLPKSHANDAVAIACEIGEIVKPGSNVYQIRCIGRGNYQLYNGKRSEHKVWGPKKLHGWKLYELVVAKGQMGYIGGRRVKGAFVVKDVVSGKKLLEVTPRKLRRLSRPVGGWMISRFPVPQITGKEGGASSPS